MKKPSFKRERVDSKILSGFQNIQFVVNQPGLSNLQVSCTVLCTGDVSTRRVIKYNKAPPMHRY